MAYPNMNRCPQNEVPDFQDYFYTLIRRIMGTPATDWSAVMEASGIPAGYGPGVKADASYPLFALTQQYSGGPKGRIFLPTDRPDSNGYYTRCIQYLDDAAGTRRAAAARCKTQAERDRLLKENFADVNAAGLVWAWYWIAGHDYVPVQGILPGPTPPPSSGMTPAEVQAMIDASINAALAPIYTSLDNALKFGDKVALRIASGKLASVQGGGPTTDDQPIVLITRPDIHAWESFTIEKGE